MKAVGIREVKALLSSYVARAQKERILIMNHGRPVALLTGIEGRDLEDVILENDPAFWRMIRKSRRQRSGITLEEASKRLGIPRGRRVRKRHSS